MSEPVDKCCDRTQVLLPDGSIQIFFKDGSQLVVGRKEE